MILKNPNHPMVVYLKNRTLSSGCTQKPEGCTQNPEQLGIPYPKTRMDHRVLVVHEVGVCDEDPGDRRRRALRKISPIA